MNSENKVSKKTKSLNQSGAFLQIYVIEQLRKRDWSVLPEQPVRISPFLDLPSKNPLVIPKISKNQQEVTPINVVRAIRESMDKTSVKETSIDVIAAKTANEYIVNLCIEVKKLDPRFIDWVFFRQVKHEEQLRFLIRQRVSIEPVLLKTPPTTYIRETYLGITTLGNEFNYPVCDFALSLKSEEIDREYYKSDKTKIDEAARQIMEGMYGFTIDRTLHQIQQGDPKLRNGFVDCFISIVVTNANLFICEFNKDSINPESGKIEEEPTYQSVDSLIYECPTPKAVQFPEPLEANTTSEENIAITKWHVLILSPKGFNEFLQKIGRNPN